MSSTRYDVRGRTAVITLDYPPINGLGAALRTDLLAALDRALADNDVKAVVVTGSERAFSGGADIKEFGTANASREPRLPVLIAAFEDSPKPVVAAIAGVCMGGGLELALGAHYRVAKADAQIAPARSEAGPVARRRRHAAAAARDRPGGRAQHDRLAAPRCRPRSSRARRCWTK